MVSSPTLLSNDMFFTDFLPIAVLKVAGETANHTPDFTAMPHWHNFCELVIITRGSGLQVINNVEYPVKAGDVFFIQDRTSHYFSDYVNLKLVNIVFARNLFSGLEDYLTHLPGYNMVFRLEPELRNQQQFKNRLFLDTDGLSKAMTSINLLEEELNHPDEGQAAASIGILFNLIVFLSRTYSSQAMPRQTMGRIADLISHLEKKFGCAWTLEKMAKYTSMSPNNLLRSFHKATGMTPGNYLLNVRLANATRMLKSTLYSIQFIAIRCGFSDSNYFTKKFTQKYAQPPRAFRKQNQEHNS